MPILDSELKLYKSAVINETITNGGVMSADAVVSGVANNVFPNVFKADRLAGITTYRKLFLKVANDNDETLFNPQLWLDILTPAMDWVVFFVGDQIDTQNDIVGTERKYGCGTLRANVSSTGQTLTVDLDDPTLTSGNDIPFVAGDTIRITDKVTIDSGSGNEEEHVIAGGGVTDSGDYLTITIVGNLANDYTTAANTRVMSICEPSDIACAFTTFVDTTAGNGTYDETGGNLALDNIGTVQQDWTITILAGGVTCEIEGDVLGVVATGVSIASDVAPSNPDFTKPYFTLAVAGWADTWAENDTITFTTSPASVAIWEKRVVPAGSTSLAGDKTTLVFSGESV